MFVWACVIVFMMSRFAILVVWPLTEQQLFTQHTLLKQTEQSKLKLRNDLWPHRWLAVSCQHRGGRWGTFLTTAASRRPAPTSCHASSLWRWVFGHILLKRDQYTAQRPLVVLIRLDSRLNIWAWSDQNIESHIEGGLCLAFGSYEPTTEGNICRIWRNST